MRASVLTGNGPRQRLNRILRNRHWDRRDRQQVEELERQRAQLRQKYADLSAKAQSDEEDERIAHDHRDEDEPLFERIEHIESGT
jgi:hypothetical protein